MKRSLTVGLLLGCAGIVVAGQPGLSFNRTIDYVDHNLIGNCYTACTRANGGILFADGYADWIMQVASPLTTNGTGEDAANSMGAYKGTFATDSWQGITFDGTNYFASGYNGGTSVLVKLTDPNNGGVYTAEALTISPSGPYSGVTAVGAGKLVMADFNTGVLQFFTVNGSTAQPDGQPIPNPNQGTFKTTQAVYYNAGSVKKIFVYMVDASKTRRIDVFNTDGTSAGTQYAGKFCNELTSNFTISGAKGMQVTGMTVDTTKQVLVATVNLSTTGTNGYDLFDLSTIATDGNAAPYNQLRDNALNNSTGSNHLMSGAAFFTSGGKTYLALTSANRLSVYEVTAPAAVNDWSMY